MMSVERFVKEGLRMLTVSYGKGLQELTRVQITHKSQCRSPGPFM